MKIAQIGRLGAISTSKHRFRSGPNHTSTFCSGLYGAFIFTVAGALALILMLGMITRDRKVTPNHVRLRPGYIFIAQHALRFFFRCFFLVTDHISKRGLIRICCPFLCDGVRYGH